MAAPPSAKPSRNALPVFLLFVAGLAIWLVMGEGRGIGLGRITVIAAAGFLAWLPPVSSRILAVLDRLRHRTSRQMTVSMLIIAATAAGYFTLTALLQDRDFFPKTHDDCSYVIQMQMLARGRLWMPAHPLADFFDTFYVLVRPVYASQYFPGAAMLYLPTIWLHWPTWIGPVLAAGAAVGLIYRIISELIDGAAGALAALWIASLSWFRMTSILVLSQVPALLFGLLMIWGWLNWRRSRRRGWIVLIGIAAGWSAITRPLDALCYIVPVMIALALDLRRRPLQQWLGAGAILLVTISPFAAVQLTLDKGVTGHFVQTPFGLYLQRDVPGTELGFPGAIRRRPQSALPQKQEYYPADWVVPFIDRHQPGRVLHTWLTRWLPMMVDVTMPTRAMLPLAAAGLVGLACRRRWIVAATFVMFVCLYLFYTIFLEHYAIAVIPAVILISLLGVWELPSVWPSRRGQIFSVAMTVVLMSCVTSFWEVNRWLTRPENRVSDETFASPMLRVINEDLPAASDLQKPAVILFRHHPGNFVEEPVYNWDVAWPDDAAIIRAHDLGPQRDRQIVDYYAARGPVRAFYLFDSQSKNVIEPLGTTRDPAGIIGKLEQAEPATKPIIPDPHEHQ